MESGNQSVAKGSLSVALAVPVRNAGAQWRAFCAGVQQQSLPLQQVLVLDSMSTDATAEIARQAGFTVIPIPPGEFSHGGTRQLAIERLAEAEIVIFLTQDALLTDPDSLEALVAPFRGPQLGSQPSPQPSPQPGLQLAAVYGRQLPRAGAGAIEAHARLFNYPEQGHITSWEDRERLGIRAAFLSNSFAAYRRSALLDVGGFARHTIMAEDALAAARLLMAGWQTAYVAEARVVHSHAYTVGQEFARYFDTGVYHHREAWLLQAFGTAGREGPRFVASELRYLLRHAPHLIPLALLRSAAKWLGYTLGRNEAHLPRSLCRRLSLQPGFWERTSQPTESA